MQVPNPTMILALLVARPRHPLVVTYQSDVIRQRLRAALFRPLEQLAYGRVRAILSTSPMYAHGSRFLRLYHDRLHVLPNGIDLVPYSNPSPEHRREAERIRGMYPGPLWLGVGRMIYYKGFLNAVRAMTRVPGTLLLVGEGPEEPAVAPRRRDSTWSTASFFWEGCRTSGSCLTIWQPRRFGSPPMPVARHSGSRRLRRWRPAVQSSTPTSPTAASPGSASRASAYRSR